MPQCAVPNCTKQNGLRFPNDPSLSKKWVIAIKREEPGSKGKLWTPNKTAVVCPLHFTEDDYQLKNVHGKRTRKRVLKQSAIPSVNLPNTTNKKQTKRDLKAKRQRLLDEEHSNPPGHDLELGAEHDIPELENEIIETEEFTKSSSQTAERNEIDTDLETFDQSTQTQACSPYSYQMMDDRMIQYYTGLECKGKFELVLQSLGLAANHLNYYYSDDTPALSIQDQLLITLIKLRTAKPNIELSILFGVSVRSISNIFITWVNFMYFQWKEVKWWPDQQTVRFFAPSGFKQAYPNTRVIIDGTECPLSKPKKPLAQQATFSGYKNRNTVKVLVGATPGGVVSYMSEAYGGSASDRQIVERSDLAKMCEPGDEIMSDKGFNVEDLFIPHQVMVNIPTFFKKKNRMSQRTVHKDRRIASKRVHIERIIGLGKTYAILRNPMNHMEGSMATQITSVIFWLCNFRACIVPKTA